MLQDSQLLKAAHDIRVELVGRFPEWAEYLKRTEFRIWSMSSCAGKAWKGRNLVKMSRSYFSDERNFVAEYDDTVRHEIAHLLAPIGSVHNRDWARIAVMIGGKPERCHNLELAAGFKKRRRRHTIARCNCGEKNLGTQRLSTWVMTPEYIQKNNSGYRCEICNGFLYFVRTELR